ncbi:MAG TPA: excinuclease ABC subunit UvrC [Candidatus Polarisedimenticolia bacterium]|jgi:excinuclease ABC subunit C|nr:excinuclease ABC subunit UvrC [Candidatus Polarisedimenticolia bacterium]
MDIHLTPEARELLLEDKLSELPDAPGVYLYKDGRGRVLYVGKAASLRSRVRSYFQKSAQHPPKTLALVAEIRDLELILTASGTEALILENNLIKRERPRYNVLMRDDKNFPYLKMTFGDPFPRVVLVRRAKLDGSLYFGPFLPASGARKALRMVARFFRVAICHERLDGSRPRPCLYYQLNQCTGPCAGLVAQEDYRQQVQEARMFLEGRNRELLGRLKERMQEASRQEQFETAAHYRDLLHSIEGLAVRQRFSSVGLEDQDYFAHHREGDQAALQIFQMRHGVVASRREFTFEKASEPEDELTAAYLQQYYASVEEVPAEIYVPAEPAGKDLLEEWLSQRKGVRVRILVPHRGPKRAFLETVAQNAKLAFESVFRSGHTHGVEAAEALRESLGLEETPLRIEAFDISNLHGSDSVASMVVWEGGKMRPAEYRTFRVKTVEGADDFASIAEVVGRRYTRLVREGKDLPDLVLIDGGKGQLSAAAAVLEKLDLVTLRLVSIAKREEILHLKGQDREFALDHSSPALHLVQRIRDEAHRFAITRHRRSRSRRTLTTALMEIPGIGVSRARRLLKTFGSVKGILAASQEDLVREVGPALAERIRRNLSGPGAREAGEPSVKADLTH